MMIHCNSKMASMQAEQFFYFNNSRLLGEDLALQPYYFGSSKMHLSPPSGLGCCPF